MKSKKLIYFFGILLLLVIAFGALHLLQRENVPKNTLHLVCEGKDYYVAYEDLDLDTVTGIRVNGKGEEIPVEAQGIRLGTLLESLQLTPSQSATIHSADSYTATVTLAEIQEPDKVYLLMEEDGLRLVVFGDTNSKRSVSGVIKIVIQ